eukprot:symbB.v1.2.025381.t1/scaffold2459.1/size78741/5
MDTSDVVFNTAEIRSYENCAVEFGPTADDFFAWRISRGAPPFDSYVPKDKAEIHWQNVMLRRLPPPLDPRSCSAYKQADYDTMKANISICSTIIGDASCLISFAWEWYATSLSICLCPENYVEV